MMVWTDDGYWFAFNRTTDGIRYDIHQWNDVVKSGTCKTDDEVWDIFEAFVAAQRMRLN